MRVAATIGGILLLVAIGLGLMVRLTISTAHPAGADSPAAQALLARDMPPLPPLRHKAGFAATTPPHNGSWYARMRGLDNIAFTGYMGDRQWDISTRCEHGHPCRYMLARFVPGDTPDIAPLRRTAGGWVADYDTTAYCGKRRGRWLRWRLQMHLRLRFSRDRRRLVGAESEQAAGVCGHARGTRVWIGSRL